jgi:hypothetical protein
VWEYLVENFQAVRLAGLAADVQDKEAAPNKRLKPPDTLFPYRRYFLNISGVRRRIVVSAFCVEVFEGNPGCKRPP